MVNVGDIPALANQIREQLRRQHPWRIAFIIHLNDGKTLIISPYERIRKENTLKRRRTCITLEMNTITLLRIIKEEMTVRGAIEQGLITIWPTEARGKFAMLKKISPISLGEA